MPIHTFVIRLWQEWSLVAPQWRGRIEHLQSGQHTAFEDLDRIQAFIQATVPFANEPAVSLDDQVDETSDY